MTPEQLQEFERLLTEFGNAAFECGAWREFHADDYELMVRKRKAREAVIAFVKELVK